MDHHGDTSGISSGLALTASMRAVGVPGPLDLR